MNCDVTEPINKNDTPKPDKATLMTRSLISRNIFFREICCCEFFSGEYQNSKHRNSPNSKKFATKSRNQENFLMFFISTKKLHIALKSAKKCNLRGMHRTVWLKG